jgi:hypothetical protein
MDIQEKESGVAIRAQFDYLSPSKLNFDPSNPRFGGELSRKTQDQIEEILIADPTLRANWWIHFLKMVSLTTNLLLCVKKVEYSLF